MIASQLRAGNAGSARGASSLLAEAIGTAKAWPPNTAAAGKWWYGQTRRFQQEVHRRLPTRHGEFSVTMPITTKVRTAIATMLAWAGTRRHSRPPMSRSSRG